jgi:hypothetical protein
MAIMVLTRNGETREVLISGLTYGEEQSARAAYEAEGWTVTIRYGVWS